MATSTSQYALVANNETIKGTFWFTDYEYLFFFLKNYFRLTLKIIIACQQNCGNKPTGKKAILKLVKRAVKKTTQLSDGEEKT